MAPFRRIFRRPHDDVHDVRHAVDEELAFHLEEAEAELVEEGMSPDRARQEARRRFGDLEATRAYCVGQQTRRTTGGGWAMMLDELRENLGYALRTIRRAPGYATVVVLTLAAGISASTVVFSLINPYFLRPLPYGDAEDLVQFGQVDPRYGWDGARLSLDMMEDYRDAAPLDAVGLYYYGFANATGPEGAERLQIGYLSENMFDVLRATPALGRTFASGEGGPGGADVVVLDWGLWQRRWAGDPSVVGRTVTLDGVPYTVIGVMPRNFTFPFGGVKLWTTIRSSAATEERDDAYYIPVARLAPGWTPASAEEELDRIHAGLAGRYPDVDGAYTGIRVKPIREALNFAWEVLRLGLTSLLGAVLFLLAIACVNVASLTLARARARSREVAVRSAIGAGRARIARQLLTESLLLALVGGTLGGLLAYWLVGLVGPFVPEDLFRVGEVTVDRTVLGFSLGVTLLTPLVFGLAPAVDVTRSELSAALREGRGGGRRSLRVRRLLVVAELALAVVLVTGTGLMVRSFLQIRRVDLGFDADRLLTAEVTPPASDYAGPAEYGSYFLQATGALAALPGVEAVGQVYPLPLNHETIPILFALPGAEPADRNRWPSALWASVDTGYFRAMGIHRVAGRTFDASDVTGGGTVVVVNHTLAERHFPDGRAVGRTLRLAAGDTTLDATVVGVVADVVTAGFEDGPVSAQIYRPQTQNPRRRRFLVIRTAGGAGSVAGPARRALLDLDPDLPANLRPMNEIVLENTLQWSAGALFLGVFGLVAVLLASLGVYGLVSYSVAQRYREIGVRVALGAEARDIRRLVVREGLWLATIGGAVGVVAALGLGRLTRSLLYGVSALDPATLGGVILLFGAVALLSSVLPARRAARVDPSEVLRQE